MTGMRGSGLGGPGRMAKGQAKKRVVVTFEDNRHLPRLLGEYDAHLALIEDRLGIEAHAHGNVVVLAGSEAACEIAREVLEAKPGPAHSARARLAIGHAACCLRREKLAREQLEVLATMALSEAHARRRERLKAFIEKQFPPGQRTGQ